MGFRINTNVSSIAAQRSLGVNNREAESNLAKLSSGTRIAKSADDAAGLAISEKMKASIRSMKQADRNANDGISMVQTAEGGLNEVSSILTRMRELSIQTSSDTVGDSERAMTDLEYQNLKLELERISQVTEFNGKKLLNGEGDMYDFQIGALAALLFIPVYFVNRVYVRVTSRLNRELNDQLEKEVVYIERAERNEVRTHFTLVRQWRVKLSDASAYNWTIIEVLSIGVFIAILLRATVLPESETGDIFAILVYVWRLMEGLDHVPTIVQQLTRLRDISIRISQGATVEDVSETLEETDPEQKPM
jgi:hypothetical protein